MQDVDLITLMTFGQLNHGRENSILEHFVTKSLTLFFSDG